MRSRTQAADIRGRPTAVENSATQPIAINHAIAVQRLDFCDTENTLFIQHNANFVKAVELISKFDLVMTLAKV